MERTLPWPPRPPACYTLCCVTYCPSKSLTEPRNSSSYESKLPLSDLSHMSNHRSHFGRIAPPTRDHFGAMKQHFMPRVSLTPLDSDFSGRLWKPPPGECGWFSLGNLAGWRSSNIPTSHPCLLSSGPPVCIVPSPRPS